MSKIFVTGATGFLGAYVVAGLLNRNHQVIALKRKTSSTEFLYQVLKRLCKSIDGLSYTEGDILDTELLYDEIAKVDFVFHCAAKVSFNPRNKSALYINNVLGTANIVNACLHNIHVKLCYISSTAALGRAEKGIEINEQTEWKDSDLNTYYSITKYKAELEVWRGIEEGLKAVIVNPSIIIGVGDWISGSSKYFKQVYKGMPFYTQGTNGFVDVMDVAEISSQLLLSDIHSERFVLSSESVSYKDLLSEIAINIGKTPPYIKVKPCQIAIAWRLLKIKNFIDNKEPLITKQSSITSMNNFYYSSSKVIKTLNYTFKKVNTTINETCEIFLSEINNKTIK